LEARIAYAGKDLFSFALMHWVAGITFMLLVTVSVLQLREVAHPDLLAQAIRPQEPQPDLLGNLMHESVSTHAKRMALSLIIYVFLLCVLIYFPLRVCIATAMGDKLKSLLQLKFAYVVNPQLQVPCELLFFHLCMLALLEKYKNGLGGIQHHWLKFMANWMGIADRMLPMSVDKFRLVGSRPVYLSARKVDPYWIEMANVGSRKQAVKLRSSLVDHFEPATDEVYATFETKPDGERVIMGGSDFIRMPLRLPGRALRNKSGVIPTALGKYRLQCDSTNPEKPTIQLWEQVPSAPIPRPPDGWDDLGLGGADVQGRWAWGNEKKSTIEWGLAVRRPFFDKDQSWPESVGVCFKLAFLGLLSWLVGTILLTVAVTTPLVAGRTMFYILRVPDRWVHDPLGFGLGFVVVFPLARKLAAAFVSSEDSLLQRFRNWTMSFHAPPANKAVVLVNTALLFFGAAPVFLGMVYEIAFVKSDDWFAATKWPPFSRNDNWWLTWTLGTFLLYIWADFCIWGVLTRNYRAMVLEGRDAAPANENATNSDEEGSWQGKHGRMARFFDTWKAVITNWEWDRVDQVTLLQECASPIVVALVKTLLFPLVALIVFLLRFPMASGSTRAIVARSVLALSCFLRISLVWKAQLSGWFEAAHRSARNDRYLIGEILMNYGQ